MNFPVSNKPTAYLKSAFIIVVLSIIFITLYFHFHTINILIVFLIVTIPLSICLLIFQKKQSIESLEFVQNKLLVSYSKHKIEITISQIQEITASLNMGFDLRFNIIKTYTILLKKKYVFGNKLLIDYKFDKFTGISIKEDPISVKILKIELQRVRQANSTKESK